MTGQWRVPRGYEQGYQWGVDAPPGYEPVYLVARPPRPGVVNAAVILTYVGFAVATIQYALDSAIGWGSRPPSAGSGGSALAFPGAVVLTIVLVGLIGWLLPGAGAVVCAVLSRRGANPARIVLASLMGLFALVSLCQAAAGTAGAGMSAASATAGASTAVTPGSEWIDAGLSLVEFGLAVTIGVLLLVPPAQRYFSPGPGRRFAPAG